MREWRKQIERESRSSGWGTNAPQVPLYVEREVDCDGTRWHASKLADDWHAECNGVVRNELAERLPGAFGPGPGRLPG